MAVINSIAFKISGWLLPQQKNTRQASHGYQEAQDDYSAQTHYRLPLSIRMHMIRYCIFYLVLSISLVLSLHYVKTFIIYIDITFSYLNVQLTPLFKLIGLSLIERKAFLLTVLPLSITAILGLIYKLIKGSYIPYFITINWLIWTVIFLSDVLMTQQSS